MLLHSKGWYKSRARLYSEIARTPRLGSKLDSVFFRMSAPESGCIDFEIFVNGERAYAGMFSNLFNPFTDIVEWMERIVKSERPQQSLSINTEGPALYWTYDVLLESEYPYTGPEVGLFYLYDTFTDSIPVKAIVDAKAFVTALYLAILHLGANTYNGVRSNFKDEWYYDNNQYCRKHFSDNWTFYRMVKSPLIELFLHSKERYLYPIPSFQKMPLVKETIHMWCDYGCALFWGRDSEGHGACIGGTDMIYTDTAGDIDLSSIEGLNEWYEEWNDRPLWSEENPLPEDWKERGMELALKIRAILPDTIDLYYYSWYPEVEVEQDNEYHFPERLPMIVPNAHAVRQQQN